MTESSTPLSLRELPVPRPNTGEILIQTEACGVCHTELDEIEGRTAPPILPMVLGHQIVGTVIETGDGAHSLKTGDRIGVGWYYSSCGTCAYCQAGNDNLCPDFQATGRDAFGGYAEFALVPEKAAFPIPSVFKSSEAAPLLCAGAIGYRSLRLTGMTDGHNLGLMGFGASAHLVLKLVKHQFPKSRIYVFARNPSEREFALSIGANWSGDIDSSPPEPLDRVIDTTPAWKPLLSSLEALKPGGRLVINAIRKEDGDKSSLAIMDYSRHLWMEKEVKSVANVSRQDIADFLKIAAEIPIRPTYQEFALSDANKALVDLKTKKVRGAKVLVFS